MKMNNKKMQIKNCVADVSSDWDGGGAEAEEDGWSKTNVIARSGRVTGIVQQQESGSLLYYFLVGRI